MKSILKSKSISITKQKQSYRYKEQTGGGQREGELGKERTSEGDKGYKLPVAKGVICMKCTACGI